MQALEFPNGYYYLIINKSKSQALKIQENKPSKYEKSRVVGANPNPADNGQIWMVERLKVEGEDY